MTSKILSIVQQQLEQQGFDWVVTPISYNVTSNIESINLGSDIYILTGLMPSESDLLDNRSIVCISSPTESIQLTQQMISMLGTTILKTFREHIIIKTMNEKGFVSEGNITPYRLDFIRITPIQKTIN